MNQSKEQFTKALEVYFNQNYDDFTKQRISRLLDEYTEEQKPVLINDDFAYKKGYKAGYQDGKEYYSPEYRKIKHDTSISKFSI
jgi:hypothetical protein